MYDSINNFPEQFKKARAIGEELSVCPLPQINGIVFAGMGGSGIAGQVVATIIAQDLTIPVVTVKDYSLPNWVDQNTLVILLSYSGNTEETLSCFADAKTRNAHIAGISSGGALEKELKQNNSTWIKIPGGMQPRAALAYLCIPLYYYLFKVGFVCNAFIKALDHTEQLLEGARNLYNTAKESNFAYQIAQKLQGKLPLIYGNNNTTEVVAARWHAQLAENSKILSCTNVLPEMNHNEVEVFNSNLKKDVAVVWLLDESMHERSKKRYAICSDLIAPYVETQITVDLGGNCFMERLFHAMYLGDWVSYWLAELNETDPLVIPMISVLKDKMQD
jgi:glucose/mannose-6-phosphate isomerase